MEHTDDGFSIPEFDIPEMEMDVNFDFASPEDDALQGSMVEARLTTCRPRYVLYDNAVRMARECIPDFGRRFDAFLSGNFIFGDFLEALLTTHNIRAERMTIATLSLSQENTDSLHGLMTHGYIGDLTLLVSGYFFRNERRKLIPYITEMLGDRLTLVVSAIHTKTIHFETTGGRKVVMHGSANLRSSQSIEQVTIEENPELYDFYERIYGRIIRDYTTRKRSLDTPSKIWDVVERKEV